MPVAVDVGDAGPYGSIIRVLRSATAPFDFGIQRDIRETAAIVAEQSIFIAIHVCGVQIEVAVLVIVEPDRTDSFARIGQAIVSCNVNEAAAAVPKQSVRPVTETDEQVEIAIAVKIDPA